MSSTTAGLGFISSDFFNFGLFTGRVDWLVIWDIFFNGDLVLYGKQCQDWEHEGHGNMGAWKHESMTA